MTQLWLGRRLYPDDWLCVSDLDAVHNRGVGERVDDVEPARLDGPLDDAKVAGRGIPDLHDAKRVEAGRVNRPVLRGVLYILRVALMRSVARLALHDDGR